MQNFMRKILVNANEGENKLKVYTRVFGVNSESHFQEMERLGFATHMVIGYKGNEYYLIKYNQKELAYMDIDIYKEKFYDGLQFVMEQHKDRIEAIKNKLSISASKKEELLRNKAEDKLSGCLIDFCVNGVICREYYLIENEDGEKFVLTNNGTVCDCKLFHDVMKEIYGENVDAIVQRTQNSHLLALCRLH